jgi:hypothetical protein
MRWWIPTFYLAEAIGRVKRHDAGDGAIDGIARRRRHHLHSRQHQLLDLGMRPGEFLGVEQRQNDVQTLLGIRGHQLGALDQLHRDFGRRHRRFGTARSGASKDDLRHLVGMTQCEFLRDHAAHGNAEDLGLGDVERAQQIACVIRHLLDGVGALGFVAHAGAAIVEVDALEAGQHRERRQPCDAGHAESHDEEQRFAIAESIVVEVDRSGLDFRHDAGLLEVEKKSGATDFRPRPKNIIRRLCQPSPHSYLSQQGETFEESSEAQAIFRMLSGCCSLGSTPGAIS